MKEKRHSIGSCRRMRIPGSASQMVLIRLSDALHCSRIDPIGVSSWKSALRSDRMPSSSTTSLPVRAVPRQRKRQSSSVCRRARTREPSTPIQVESSEGLRCQPKH
eukprot:scaffold301151_cov31-Tisochrysis_lutea.AAC.1